MVARLLSFRVILCDMCVGQCGIWVGENVELEKKMSELMPTEEDGRAGAFAARLELGCFVNSIYDKKTREVDLLQARKHVDLVDKSKLFKAAAHWAVCCVAAGRQQGARPAREGDPGRSDFQIIWITPSHARG